jgi:hypothetical protein
MRNRKTRLRDQAFKPRPKPRRQFAFHHRARSRAKDRVAGSHVEGAMFGMYQRAMLSASCKDPPPSSVQRKRMGGCCKRSRSGATHEPQRTTRVMRTHLDMRHYRGQSEQKNGVEEHVRVSLLRALLPQLRHGLLDVVLPSLGHFHPQKLQGLHQVARHCVLHHTPAPIQGMPSERCDSGWGASVTSPSMKMFRGVW